MLGPPDFRKDLLNVRYDLALHKPEPRLFHSEMEKGKMNI